MSDIANIPHISPQAVPQDSDLGLMRDCGPAKRLLLTSDQACSFMLKAVVPERDVKPTNQIGDKSEMPSLGRQETS